MNDDCAQESKTKAKSKWKTLSLEKKKAALEQQRRWRKRNPDRVRASMQKWRDKNPEKRRQIEKKWRDANKPTVAAAYKRWLQSKGLQHLRQKRISNPQVAAAGSLRLRMRMAIQAARAGKTSSSQDMLGAPMGVVLTHIEKQFQRGMNWGNWGKTGWHVDHIIPCAAFDLTDPQQQRRCFHYTNLRPVWASENLSKNARIITCQPELPLKLA